MLMLMFRMGWCDDRTSRSGETFTIQTENDLQFGVTPFNLGSSRFVGLRQAPEEARFLAFSTKKLQPRLNLQYPCT
jgi:hypothetical protein